MSKTMPIGKTREMRKIPDGHQHPVDGEVWYVNGLGYCISRSPFQWLSWKMWKMACDKDSNVWKRLGFLSEKEVYTMFDEDDFDQKLVWDFDLEFISLDTACENSEIRLLSLQRLYK